MFSVLRKISAFAGNRRGLLKKSMLVAFLGVALQTSCEKFSYNLQKRNVA